MSYICYHCFKQKQTDEACPFCGYDGHDAAKIYPLALKAGSILNGRYTVGRVLGQGGFGITYIAQDYQSGDRVAIKEYLPTDFAGRESESRSVLVYSGERRENFEYGRKQFLEEARTLAAFNGDEHIVRIHSYFEENNTAYFVMEYVDGYALDQYMAQKGGRLTAEETNQLLLPLMESLSAVHEKGIIHRDIAPDNIIITKGGSAKLIDFGAARYSTGEKSKSLDVILKHGFAPKEQYLRRGRQGPFTDIYALAATYYYAITGKVPPEAIERMDEDNLIPPSSLRVKIPGKAEDVLFKALEVNASDRYQSMAEFHRDMLAAMPEVIEPTPIRFEAAAAPKKRTEKEALEEAALFERRAREAREEAARLEQERKDREAREEAARKAREEAERRERERKAREEAERREQERREEETRRKAERLEQERRAKEEAERIRREQQKQKAREEVARKERQRLEQEAKEQKKAEKEQAKRSSKALPVVILLLAAIAAAVILPGKLRSPQVQEPIESKTPIVEEAASPELQEPVGETTEENAEREENAIASSATDQTDMVAEDLEEVTALSEQEDGAHATVPEEHSEIEATADEQEPVIEEPALETEDGEEIKETETAVSSDLNQDAENLLETTESEELPVENAVTEPAAEEYLSSETEPVEASTVEESPSLDTDVEGYLAALKTVGNTVLLGHYEQDNNPENGPEPVEWIVLAEQNGQSLLISKYVLDWMLFQNDNYDTTWDRCTLRSWMNGDFINETFSNVEQSTIIQKTLENSNGVTTQDKVFALSTQEAGQYFESVQDRCCEPTEYATGQGASVKNNGFCAWLLRTHNEQGTGAQCILWNGTELGKNLLNEHAAMGIRPALWVDSSGLGTPGYSVTFGHYEQDNDLNNGPEPIEWIVLDAKDGKSLLISKFALDSVQYNSVRNNVTWESSSIRKWLNNDFLSSAFTEEEKEALPFSMIDNSKAQGDDIWKSYGGNNTRDQIFLLSRAEMLQYFQNSTDRECQATEYAVSRGVSKNEENGAAWWWLRSPGRKQDEAAIVDTLGISNRYAIVSYPNRAVRPAVWADQEKLRILFEKNELREALFNNASIGNTVLFGHYEQDNDLANGSEPIEWIVIGEEDNSRLLLSKYALDCKPYYEQNAWVIWESCSLRKWLNREFLNSAFDASESGLIKLSIIDNSSSQSRWKQAGGNNTSDLVFLLSYKESQMQYLRAEEQLLKCKATAYAIQQGASTYGTEDARCWWWLRSPGTEMNRAMSISPMGTPNHLPVNTMDWAVRPAIWIDVTTSQ